MVKICPMIMKGYSTGCIPIQVNIKNVIIKVQNINLLIG